MPANYLITGPPRSGKTTVIERTRDRLEDDGYTAGGIVCPELQSDGSRVGFEICDVMTGETRILAHVDRDEGPSVGKYRVAVENVDRVSAEAFDQAFASADLILIDEIAPMEVYSDEFTRQVRRAFDARTPVLAAIHYRSTEGFIGEIKSREDTEVFEVTEETRDSLPGRLAERVRSARLE